MQISRQTSDRPSNRKFHLKKISTISNLKLNDESSFKRIDPMISNLIHDTNLIFKISDFMVTIINNLFYFYYALSSLLISKIIFAVSLFFYFNGTLQSLENLFIFLGFFYLIEATLILPFCRKNKANSDKEQLCYAYDIITKIADLIAIFGAYLFVTDKIAFNSVWLFTIPKLLVSFYARFFLIHENSPSVLSPSLYILESIQWLLIGLNISFNLSLNWSFILAYYFFFSICSFMMSLLVIFFVLMMGTALLFKLKSHFEFSGAGLLACFFFYLIWIGLIYNSIFSFILAIIQGGLLNSVQIIVSIDFLSQLKLFAILGLVNLFFLNICFWIYNWKIKNGLISDQTVLEIADFCDEINLCAKISDDVIFLNKIKPKKTKYVKVKSNVIVEDDEPLIKDIQELCVLCQLNEADIYIKPCEHSGMCLNCIKDNLDKEFECPVCHQPIDRLYLIEPDRDTEKYIATPVIFDKEI